MLSLSYLYTSESTSHHTIQSQDKDTSTICISPTG